jgi:hypothetical protein
MQKKDRETIGRDEVVRLLRRASLHKDADEVEQILPEVANHEYCHRLLASRGITLEKLMDRLGGSP